TERLPASLSDGKGAITSRAPPSSTPIVTPVGSLQCWAILGRRSRERVSSEISSIFGFAEELPSLILLGKTSPVTRSSHSWSFPFIVTACEPFWREVERAGRSEERRVGKESRSRGSA